MCKVKSTVGKQCQACSMRLYFQQNYVVWVLRNCLYSSGSLKHICTRRRGLILGYNFPCCVMHKLLCCRDPAGTGEYRTSPKEAWVLLHSAVYEKSKEKMSFSQYQEETKLGGSWSCVIVNGEN